MYFYILVFFNYLKFSESMVFVNLHGWQECSFNKLIDCININIVHRFYRIEIEVAIMREYKMDLTTSDNKFY